MIYLNESHIRAIGINWSEIIETIKDTVIAMSDGDYAQPIKPYLRYKDPVNRIIAMPAYVGGKSSSSGIKWIASFPNNLTRDLPRAHSVTILNKADTGVPFSIINTPIISAIRTAGVTALVLDEFIRNSAPRNVEVGIAGYGPIGKMHLDMVFDLLKDKVSTVKLFDIREIDREEIHSRYSDKVVICDTWEETYCSSDIFITCTVSKKPYINIPPKPGSLQLNVSLRDYCPEILNFVNMIVVDDWEEVCRENTDVEVMHKELGLQKEDTVSIVSLITQNLFKNKKETDIVMFNPMGMATFDIAVGNYYYLKAINHSLGTVLQD